MTERRKSILTTIFLALVVLAFAWIFRNVPVPPDCRFDPQECGEEPKP